MLAMQKELTKAHEARISGSSCASAVSGWRTSTWAALEAPIPKSWTALTWRVFSRRSPTSCEATTS
ncbi:hypothetical protein HETIRDRAFT_175000 [Heterobasidion irregulare TC 32-1]|uniref:Uncharacterized protein n=1 Tax=Heterobasidion irregulare (strain TC 32-1) TaxID=747525 RepID=W4JTS4_HETIT|nr:uncharacterized protein HETIRDRAFT_175000 [Heterobasidion irregulare TC 32-1]ETW76962.1 hypothetical protein HETIRDRAFT_175000 [Heterobasidion irregulare TC 32-1]